MCGVDLGSVKAADLCNADEALKTTRFARLRHILDISPVGKEILASVTDLLRRSAYDEIADSRVTFATDTFRVDGTLYHAKLMIIHGNGQNVLVVGHG